MFALFINVIRSVINYIVYHIKTELISTELYYTRPITTTQISSIYIVLCY